MKFFVDTANLAEIAEAADLGILDGVTTNPSLLAKEGVAGYKQTIKHYEAICKLVEGPVSAEVVATDYKNIMYEGDELAELHPNIVVKVPMSRDGIKAISYFNRREIRTNCTLVFSAGQAILAAKAGATYVSPFLGRLDDIATDGLELITQIRTIYGNYYSFDTQILAASVRHPMHIVQCSEIGADAITGPLSVLTALFNHPLTESGLAKFLNDYNHVTASNNQEGLAVLSNQNVLGK